MSELAPSWYRVLASSAVGPREARPSEVADAQLVVFRTESGLAVVLDAHCPHLGAHLGHGGRVEGENIRCPFHDFAFDADGKCVRAGSCERYTHLRTSAHPAVERFGSIFVWLGSARPTFELPEIEGFGDGSVQASETFAGDAAHAVENLVDFEHFRFVHAFDAIEGGEVWREGDVLRSRFRFSRRHPLAPWRTILIELEAHIAGLGISISRLRMPELGLEVPLVTTPTPKPDSTFELTLTLGPMKHLQTEVRDAVPRRILETVAMYSEAPFLLPFAERLIRKALLWNAMRDAESDRPIWAHRCGDRARYVRTDVGPRLFREYVRELRASRSAEADV